jgi:Xaa-Pro aminopeptidase
MPYTDADINLVSCRARQQKILKWMEANKADLLIVTQIEHVQYFVGPRFRDVFSPTVAIESDGHVTLVAPRREPPVCAADDVLTYESNWHSTLRNDQREESSRVLLQQIKGRSQAKRVACEFATFPPHLAQHLNCELIDVEPELYRMRRQKYADELACLRIAIAGTAAMHQRAREIVEPGINELHVFNELQAFANRAFEEVMTGTGNDYASGARGGPPRDRNIQLGELYILDLGPAFRGYYADNTRTIAVGARVTDPQQEAWQYCIKVFDLIEREVRPGKRCRELFEEAQEILDQSPVGDFDHHLGHGIGLFPHEAPHLNPFWDDEFQVGEVFAVEPGLYAPELNVGMRLENNYLVTGDGVELLTDFPLEL